MIHLINRFGAVSTVSEETYKAHYARNPDFRKLTAKQLAQYGKLKEAIAELEAQLRSSDPEARQAAAAKLLEAREKFDALLAKLMPEDTVGAEDG